MNLLRPLLTSLLITLVLCFNACQKDPSKICIQKIISDPNYFSVDRTLTNNCKKQQGIDYILTGNKTYVISANLLIEEGTIIEVQDSAALVIETTGTLQAKGTTDAPIIIRRHHKSTGHWRGLFVRSTSSLNELQHVHLKNAGGASIAGSTARGAVVLLDQGTIAINASKIEGSASYGINIASTAAKLTSLKNNIITNNNIPMRLHTTQATTLSSNNDLTGNKNNFVQFCIQPFINENYTWPMLNIPYRLMPLDSSSTPTQLIAGTGSLTIAPGSKLEMTQATGFAVRDLGQLSVIGTPERPILFTGVIKNYSTWEGFEFRFTPKNNRFEHVRIEHAGSKKGIIYMWGNPRLTLDKVELTYSSSCAFYDAPKTASQSVNSNLFFKNITYSFINSQYCKGR